MRNIFERAQSDLDSDLDYYQERCAELRTYPDTRPGEGLVYCGMALGGETGEYQNKLKKLMRGDKELTPEVRTELMHELGDVFWYLSMSAWELGIPLSMVASENIKKLHGRKARGTVQGDGDNR